MRTPREHGFWVMLTVATFTGLSLAPSWTSVGIATACAGIFVVGAVSIGRKIRKNTALQLLAAPTLTLVVVPVGWGTTLTTDRFVALVACLGLVFLTTTMAVQTVLFRARHRVVQARLVESLGIALAGVGAVVGFVVWGRWVGIPLASVCLFVGVLALIRPSARRLKRVGIAVALIQGAVATMLVQWV